MFRRQTRGKSDQPKAIMIEENQEQTPPQQRLKVKTEFKCITTPRHVGHIWRSDKSENLNANANLSPIEKPTYEPDQPAQVGDILNTNWNWHS